MLLNYNTYGNGRPIIVLHGLFGSLDNWHTLAKNLGQYYQIWTLDQRNHGRSPHAPLFDYQVLAADLGDFMDQQNISSASLIGHSMGGKTAMEFALHYPDRVDQLMIVDIAPKAYPRVHETLFQGLLNVELKDFQHRKEIEEALKSIIPDIATRQFILKNIYLKEDGSFSWRMNLTVLYENYDKINQAIEAQEPFKQATLFMRGEKSNYIENKDIELIKTLFPQATLTTISGAGHWVHAEAPKQFLAEALEFFNT